MKHCIKCKRDLPLESFGKCSKSKDGLKTYCKECVSEYDRVAYENNREKICKRVNNYYSKFPNNVYVSEYYKAHKEEVKKYKSEKYRNDKQYRLSINLRTRIRQALKRGLIKKSTASNQLLGCSIDELKQHIESLWQEGMSWDNYGKWHIDHKIPCATFDLTLEEEQKKCFHFSNLRPLWAKDNLSRPKFGQDLS